MPAGSMGKGSAWTYQGSCTGLERSRCSSAPRQPNPALSQHQGWAWDCCSWMGKARGWVRREQVFSSAAGQACVPLGALLPFPVRCCESLERSPHPGPPSMGFIHPWF